MVRRAYSGVRKAGAYRLVSTLRLGSMNGAYSFMGHMPTEACCACGGGEWTCEGDKDEVALRVFSEKSAPIQPQSATTRCIVQFVATRAVASWTSA